MSKGLKVISWIISVLIVLILVMFAAVKIFFPAEKVRALIINNIEKALDRKVTVGDASVSIWGGVGLKLKSLEISDQPGFSEGPFFTLENLNVKMKIMPLLKGKYEFSKISLNSFTLLLEKNKSGTMNIDNLGSQDDTKISTAKGAASVPFLFENLAVTNSRLVFIDDSSGYNISLNGIGLNCKLEKNGFDDVYYSEGMLKIARLIYRDDKRQINLPGFDFSAELRTRLNQKSEIMEIEKINIGLAQLKGQLDGRISSIYTSPTCELNFITKKFSTLQMASVLPPEMLASFAKWKNSGEIFASASLVGALFNREKLEFTGKVNFENIVLGHPSINGDLVVESGEINIHQRAANFLFENCTFAGEPLSLKVYMKDVFKPQLTGELELSVNLNSFKDYSEEIKELSGRVYADINLNCDLNEPETTQIDGGLVLEDIRLVHSKLAYPIEEIDLECEFRRRDILIDSIDAEIGSSNFKMNGVLINIIPFLVAPDKAVLPPEIHFTFSAPYMNFDEIASFLPVDSQTVMSADSVTGLARTLSKLSASGTIDIASGVYSQVEFENFSGILDFRDNVLNIDKITADLYGGSLDGEIIVDYEKMAMPKFQVDFSARDMEINGFLSRLTALDDIIYGRAQVSSSFTGAIGKPSDVMGQLTGNGMVMINQGYINNLPLLKAIADKLKLQTFDKEEFRDLRNSFRIQDGSVMFDNHKMKIANAEWELAGNAGFDGTLDYKINITPDNRAMIESDILGELGSLLGKKGGKVTIPLILTGSYQEPEISLDHSKLTKSADKRIKEQGQKLLDNFLKKKN